MQAKSKEHRQPKAERHEQAKQKCKIYQRSLSGKFRMIQTPQSQLPLPGQFAVHRPDQRITTNIRTIMKDSRPQTAAQFLSQNNSKKLSLGKSTTNLPKLGRQHSRGRESSLDRQKNKPELALREYEKKQKGQQLKKTSYLVRPKGHVAKYSSGYRAVKLETNQPKLRLSVPFSSAKEEEQNIPNETKFLPVEYYLIDELSPEQLMKKFRISGSDYVLAFSRWYDLEGKNSWKKCRVLGFNQQNDRWNIEWLHNSKSKQVSRANLYFQGQSRVQFEERLRVAHQIRRNSQSYYRYNIQVDQVETLVRDISEDKLNNILERTGKPDKCLKYVEEFKQLYLRANKQAEFNVRLPFDEQKKIEFEQFLPPFLFKPNEQYKLRYKDVEVPRVALSSQKFFQATAIQFKQKTSLSHKHRLSILSCMSEIEVECETKSLFFWKNEKKTYLDNILRHSRSMLDDYLRDIQRLIWNIQHFVGNQLDQMYIDKKNMLFEFQKLTKEYNSFLSMIIIRLEAAVRQVLTNSYQKMLSVFQINEQISLESTRKERNCSLLMKLVIRQMKVECEPSVRQIRLKVKQLMEEITDELKKLPCPTKTYLQMFRARGTLEIQHEPFCLASNRTEMYELLEKNMSLLDSFLRQLAEVAEQMLGIWAEVKNKMQRKTYLEIRQFISKMKTLEERLKQLLEVYHYEDGMLRVNIFLIQGEDILNKIKRRVNEGERQLYRLVFDKIARENDKLEKGITTLEQRLQVQPHNIIEMLEMQKLVRQQSKEELDKVHAKLKQLPEKIALLESIQPLEYRDFELLNRVYIKPARLKQKVKKVKKDIETTYRKRFGEQLNRDAGKVLEMTRKCNEEMLSCFKIEGLDQMCDRFMQLSNLNEKIKSNIKQAQLINEREDAMNWSQTDFGKLKFLSGDFFPYFTIATLAKNYQLSIEQLANGAFVRIDAANLEKQLEETARQLATIKELFCNNTRMLRISMEVEQQYKTFAEHMPLIKALRNPDLRERHWVSLRQLIAINPQDVEVSLRKMINSGVETKLFQLQQISTIATKQLVYEKRLIRLKRDWKEVRYELGQSDGLSIVVNLKQLCSRVEMDIFQIQQMLGANFIKFLQGEILCWRNQVLYRAYELLEKWEKIQNQVLLLASIFSKPRAKKQMARQHFQFQLLEKVWKNLCSQSDAQPAISDILQGRALQILGSLENSLERIRKQLYAFFQEKKRQYARLACISDDQFVNLLSCDESDPGENPVFEQTVRKCFQNIKSLVRNEDKQIVKIWTCYGQSISLKPEVLAEKVIEFVLPNEIIVELENKIKNELRLSIQNPSDSSSIELVQMALLYQRIKFTSQVEQELIENQCLTDEFVHSVESYRDELISRIQDNFSPKLCLEILQVLFHLQLSVNIFDLGQVDIYSFQWLSQPRSYLRGDEYVVELGLLSDTYGFEIVNLDETVTESYSARMFCSIAGIIKDRGLGLIYGEGASGKISTICKLASLFGKKEHVLDGNSLVSPRNILQFVRMAASGLWVVLRNIHNLQTPQLSILNRSLQNLWVNFMIGSAQKVAIDGFQINFKTTNLKLFATTTIAQDGHVDSKVNHMFQHTFRTIYFPMLDIEFVAGAKLLLMRIDDISASRITIIIQYIFRRFKTLSAQLSVHSELSFICKVFKYMIVTSNLQGQQLFQLGLSQTLSDLIQDDQMLEKIFTDLGLTFSLKLKYLKCEREEHKNQFLRQHYYYNQNILNTYSCLNEGLHHKNVVLLVGPHDSGKTAFIQLLKTNQKIIIHPICPNAYSLQDLYGREDINGILCCMIEQILKNLKKQPNQMEGILLDGQLGLWSQPLARIISSGHIIQPNGNRLLIQEDIKLVYECLELDRAGPDLLMNCQLLVMNDVVKWQNIFNWYLNTQFNGGKNKAFYLKYFELLIPYIVDPLMEFYQTTKEEHKGFPISTFVSCNSLITSLLQLYQSLLRYYFIEDQSQSIGQKMNSDSFNLFIMALIWTFGASLAEDSRRAFQRNFKYLIKRAVQVHLSAVAKQSLPSDDHDLFETFYNQGRWEEWKRDQLYLHEPSSILNRPIDIGLSFIVERSIQRGDGVLICGPSNGFKTLFLQQFEKQISTEAYKTMKLCLGPNSTSVDLKSELLKEMNKEKYSFNFHGFAHGKKTIVMIRDVGLPLMKDNHKGMFNLYQFIRHYYVTGGWFLSDSYQQFAFKKLIFCGTINHHHSLPTSLNKYINVFNRPLDKQDLGSVVNVIVKDILKQEPLIGDLIVDLHYSIIKELKGTAFIPFSCQQALEVAKGLTLLGQASKKQLLQFWIYLSEKFYSERLKELPFDRLFYLINGILMERQKLRYKSIRPNPEAFATYIRSNKMIQFNMTTFKKQIQKRWRGIVDEYAAITLDKNQNLRTHEKLMTSPQVKSRRIVNVSRNWSFKEPQLRLVSYLCSTFDLERTMILSLSISDGSKTPTLDLQEALEVSAALRGARLFPANVGLGIETKNRWRSILLSLVEQILISLEGDSWGKQTQELIIFFYDFREEADFILDDLMMMKRTRSLPKSQELVQLFESHLENRSKQQINEKPEQNEQEVHHTSQSKGKAREQKYELQRKEKQRQIRQLHQLVVSKVRAVVNIKGRSLDEITSLKLFTHYEDSLREFSILNVDQCCQGSINLQTHKQITSGNSLLNVANPIITDLYQSEDNMEVQRYEESSCSNGIHLDEKEERLLDKVSEKMASQCYLLKMDQWLRGLNNSLPELYGRLKNKLLYLCSKRIQKLKTRAYTVTKIISLKDNINQSILRLEQQLKSVVNKYEQTKKQKLLKELEYEQCQNNNEQLRKTIIDLEKQRVQLSINYEHMIDKTYQQFLLQRERLCECFKLAKDKKLNLLGNDIKHMLQTLGILLQRKFKKDQDPLREILKEMTSSTNSKFIKKVMNLMPTNRSGLSQKMITKLKEHLHEVDLCKVDRRISGEERQQTYSEKLGRRLRSFFSKILELSSKLQEKEIKESLKRWTDNEKADQKTREQLNKNIKSSEQRQILQSYEGVREQIDALQENIKQVKKQILQQKELKKNYTRIFEISHPEQEHQECTRCGKQPCNFICWVENYLSHEKRCIEKIKSKAKTIAFTLAVYCCYNMDDCPREIKQRITTEMQKETSDILFMLESLPELTYLVQQIEPKTQGQLQDFEYVEKQLETEAADYLRVHRQLQSLSFLGWLQFVPGAIIVGVQTGLLSDTRTSINSRGGPIGLMKQLFKQSVVNSSELLSWARRKGSYGSNRYAVSSRIIISNKSLEQMFESEKEKGYSKWSGTVLVIATSRQQYRNCMKIVRRQLKETQFTIIVVTQSIHTSLEQKAFTFHLRHGRFQHLAKRVHEIALSECQKGQLQYQNELKQCKLRQQQNTFAVMTILDTFQQNKFENIIRVESQKELSEEQIQQQPEEKDILIQQPSKKKKKVKIGSVLSLANLQTEDKIKKLDLLKCWVQNSILVFNQLRQVITQECFMQRQHLKKTQGNQHNQKFVKLLGLLCQTLLQLQEKKWLPFALSVEIFQGLLMHIFEKEGSNKKQTGGKNVSEIKVLAWNHFACLYPGQQILIFLVFTFIFDLQSDQLLLENLSQSLHICLQAYQKSRGFRLLSKKQPALTQQYFEWKESGNKRIVTMNHTLKSKVAAFQTVFKEKHLLQSFQCNPAGWYAFARQLSSKTVTIPCELHIESKLIEFFMLCLFCPKDISNWVSHLDTESWLFHPEHYQLHLHNNIKINFYRINEISYQPEWACLQDRLYYLQHNIGIKELLLPNLPISKLIQICQQRKIPLTLLDPCTLLWKLQRAFRSKQAGPSMEDEEEIERCTQGQEQFVESIKNLFKSESWIIINLDHCLTMNMTPLDLYKKISRLFEAFLSPQQVIKAQKENQTVPDKIAKMMNKNVELNLYKFMLVYPYDFSNDNIKSIYKTPVSGKQLLTYWLEVNKSCIAFKQQNNSKGLVENNNMINFIEEFYLSLNKSKKSRKEYEKWSFLQKKLLYEFVSMCHMLIRIAMNQDMLTDQGFIVNSRIQSCMNIIKSSAQNWFSEQQAQLLRKFQGKYSIGETANDAIKWKAVAKLDQYINLLLEYVFSLNNSTQQQNRRIYINHELITNIRSDILHLKSFDLEHILSQLKVEDTKFEFISDNLVYYPQQSTHNVIAVQYDPEKYEVIAGEESIYPQQEEQKLAKVLLSGRDINFVHKAQEISQLFAQQISEAEEVVKILQGLNVLQLLKQCGSKVQRIQTVMEKKHGVELSKITQKKRNSINLVILGALTQLLQNQNVQKIRELHRPQLNRLNESSIAVLLDTYRKVSAWSIFLTEINNIINQFHQFDTIESEHEIDSDSEDQEQNVRKQEMRQLKKKLRERIKLKGSVQQLNKKLSVVYNKISNSNNGAPTQLQQNHLRKIYEVIRNLEEQIEHFKGQTEQAVHNYEYLEQYIRQATINIEKSLYESFDWTELIFRFKVHGLDSIVELTKIIHAKRYHQQSHLLTVKLSLVAEKRKHIKQDEQTTLLYYKGFSLINGRHNILKDRLVVKGQLGYKTSCEELFIQAEIKESLCADDSISEENGKIQFRFCLYITEGKSALEKREVVSLFVHESEVEDLIKANVYLIGT